MSVAFHGPPLSSSPGIEGRQEMNVHMGANVSQEQQQGGGGAWSNGKGVGQDKRVAFLAQVSTISHNTLFITQYTVYLYSTLTQIIHYTCTYIRIYLTIELLMYIHTQTNTHTTHHHCNVVFTCIYRLPLYQVVLAVY